MGQAGPWSRATIYIAQAGTPGASLGGGRLILSLRLVVSCARQCSLSLPPYLTVLLIKLPRRSEVSPPGDLRSASFISNFADLQKQVCQ